MIAKLKEKLFGAKKGVGGLDAIVIGFVVLVMTFAVGLMVLGDFQESMTDNSTEYNATGDLITSMSNVTSLIGVIILVAVAAGIIFLVRGMNR